MVSWPATYSSSTNDISSAVLNRSPASSTCSSAESRSSPRCWRRWAMTSRRYSLICSAAASDASRVASSAVGSSDAVSACDQSRTSSERSVGRARRSLITWNGIGNASSSTSSIDPRSAATSSTSSTSCWTRGRSRSIADGVKAWVTRRRSRVWSGGSRLRIDFEVRPSSMRRWKRSRRRWRAGSAGTGTWASMSRANSAPRSARATSS